MTTTRRIADAIKGFFSGRKGLLRVLAMAAVPAVIAFLPGAASAASCDWYDIPCHAAHFLTWFFEILTALMGYIIVLLVDGILRVASYDNFVAPGPTAVRFGWVITRDLSNMFFIVFLLIIAFATIIGYEKYAYRSNLRRLLIMAVVINFSKTICGIFIDMSQVLLLSFVNGFKAAAAGNFLRAFQIEKLLKLADGESSYTFGLVLGMMFAFILASIAACVMLVLLVILLFRIIMLWVLIILSPIAFLTSSFPLGSENYYAKWWGMLKANLTNGPVIAFFIWLALATAQQTGGNLSSPSEGWGNASAVAKQETTAAGTVKIGSQSEGIPSEAGTTDTILSMIIMICILFAGLKFASEAQVMGSGFAKTVRGKAEGYLRRPWTAPGASAVSGSFKSVGGRAMNRVGSGLARVPVVGGLGRRMAAAGERLEEGRRQELEKRWAGSAKDLAKYNPTQAGSKRQLLGATDNQIVEMADVAGSNAKVREAQMASGADKVTRERLERIVAKDPSKQSALDAYNKATWQGIEDPKDRAKVAAKMNAEEMRKYVKPEDLNEETLPMFSKAALTGYATDGKDEMKSKVMEVLDTMAGAGTLDATMKDKRMTYADLPAEAFKAAGGKADRLRAAALAQAEKDPALMKKFADDPKMRDQLASTARTNMSAATTDIGRMQKLAVVSQLGGSTDDDFTPDVLEAVGQMSAKALSDLERGTPTDSPAAQAGLAKILEAAVKNGSTDLVQAIQRSPNLSQHVPLAAAREAEKSTGGYTSSVNAAANSKLAELDRRRRDAASSDDPTVKSAALGIGDDINQIREAMDAAKAAAKELAAVEKNIATSRQSFAEAQKGGKDAEMTKFASEIKAGLKEAFDKKDKLAKANDRLKGMA